MTAHYGWFSELAGTLNSIVSVNHVPPLLLNAYTLLHHPRRKLIRKQGWAGYVLTDGNVRLDGLTTPLRDVFHPYQKTLPTGGQRSGGSARGCTTDRELAALINFGVLPALGHAAFSKYTERVLAYLRKHGYQPFAAQYLVYDEALHIGTELDLLVIDLSIPAGINVKNFQIKTGFDNNYEAGSQCFCSPYIPDSPLRSITTSHKNTHQLQVLAEHMIVQRNYGKLLHESCVLVFSEELTSLYRINASWIAVRRDVYANLLARLTDTKEDLEINGILAGAAAKRAKSLFL